MVFFREIRSPLTRSFSTNRVLVRISGLTLLFALLLVSFAFSVSGNERETHVSVAFQSSEHVFALLSPSTVFPANCDSELSRCFTGAKDARPLTQRFTLGTVSQGNRYRFFGSRFYYLSGRIGALSSVRLEPLFLLHESLLI